MRCDDRSSKEEDRGKCIQTSGHTTGHTLASVMGSKPPPAHLPERRACSCEGPKKAHRNLVGLRRTASRSPRSVLSARASSRSFITAIWWAQATHISCPDRAEAPDWARPCVSARLVAKPRPHLQLQYFVTFSFSAKLYIQKHKIKLL